MASPTSKWSAIKKSTTAWWLRMRGWRCEGPFPRNQQPTLLVIPPDITPTSTLAALLEIRLGYMIHWWPDGAQSAAPAPVHERHSHAALWDERQPSCVLVRFDSDDLPFLFGAAARHDTPVQLITVVPKIKRLRCNTPFKPGNHPERERSYVFRLYSHAD